METKQKYHKGFTKVGKVLPDRIKEYKLQKTFYKHQAIKHWDETAAHFFGDAWQQVKAVDLKNGTLIVACLSKELAYQIKLLAKRIIEKLNTLIGKNVVYVINVEL
jgi:hypothetical protein